MHTLPVTVVITVWKRSYLESQLEALSRQTVLPAQVWVIHYEDHIEVQSVIHQFSGKIGSLFYIRSELNFKYFGRFSMASHAPGDYLWVLDDDVIPGTKWLEICYQKCNAHNAVIGCSGRIIPPGDFMPEKGLQGDIDKYFVGDCSPLTAMNYCPADTVVDFACNSYFFKTSWMMDFWSIWPFTFQSGEDIHLSATLKIKKGIATIVPAQLNQETSGNLKREYSRDEHSSWMKPGFYDIREGVFKYLIGTHGWKPVLWEQ
jgi:hypothetical protein